MADLNDMDLVREYADRKSEPAFAELVHRHINLVYSVALRYAGNFQDAQDVTQAVFIILAKKSADLRERTTLTGWLYETTRFTARQLLRTRARRQVREQEAYMASALNDSDTDNVWRQLAPLLEEAMTRLNEKERTLLALRFFENKSGAETAALLGIQEWAAHKREARALEKLRKFFTRHGASSTTAVIAGAISANSVQAAPAALAKSVTAVALAKGATASISTLTLIKGALKVMAWTKAKTAVVVGMGVLLAAGTATVAWHQYAKPRTWRDRFENVYHLKPGEVLKHIRPPYVPERAEYYHKEPSLYQQAQAITTPPPLFIFEQTAERNVHWKNCLFGGDGTRLKEVLVQLGLFDYEIEGETSLLKLEVRGDWVRREGAQTEALMTALPLILSKETGRNLHIEKRKVEREVFVARGNVQLAAGSKIQVYYKNASGQFAGGGNGKLQNFFESVGNMLGSQLVSEINEPDLSQIYDWEIRGDIFLSSTADGGDGEDGKARKNERDDWVLKHISEQTGLQFSKESRLVDRWFISEM